MYRQFVQNLPLNPRTLTGALLSLCAFSLALLLMPLVLILAATTLLCLSLFGRNYLKRQLASIQQCRHKGRQRDLYDLYPNLCRDSGLGSRGRILEHEPD
ncbi:hypothetical protein [Shewanella chilikensis]|uniref:Uncharacterized protein n=1 Tax=Shewanella chilikensis TaxID=558541 RepID=A0A6G7LMA3_9GAMM|nr:hypothetical protein [Shewanella chilikensis]QIJ02854.1 hypothetical protein GII14_00770 [Shewanella chilikensis]